MAFNVSYNIIANDQFTANCQKIAEAVDKLEKKLNQLGLNAARATAKVETLGKRLMDTGNKMLGFGQKMTLRASLPILAIGTAAIHASAQLETMRVKMNVLAGSTAAGKKMFDAAINFEKYTPFSLDQWLPVQTMMLASGVAADQTIKRMREIGDLASAGAAMGRGDGSSLLQRLGHAYAQVQAKGIMSKRDFDKFARAGVDLQSPLEAIFHMKSGNTEKGKQKNMQHLLLLMKKGKITIDALNKAMDMATGPGGRYDGMMQKLSKTFNGLASTMRSNVMLALAEVGDAFIKFSGLKYLMMGFIAALMHFTALMKKMEQNTAGKVFLKIGFAILLLLAILGPLAIVMGSIIWTFGVWATVIEGVNLAFLWLATTTWSKLIPSLWASLVPIALWVIGILAVVGVIYLLIKYHKEIFAFAHKVWVGLGHYLNVACGFAMHLLKVISEIGAALVSLITFDWSAFNAHAALAVNYALELSGQKPIAVQNNNKGSINATINMNAPKGAVRSMQSKSTGSVGAVGMNLSTR